MLDVSDDERLRRLERRDPGRWSPDAKQSSIGWARWHRGHAADPQHRTQVITTGSWDQMAWRRWIGWTSGDPRWTVTVIDTTGRTVDESAAELRRWVDTARDDLVGGQSRLRSGWTSH